MATTCCTINGNVLIVYSDVGTPYWRKLCNIFVKQVHDQPETVFNNANYSLYTCTNPR